MKKIIFTLVAFVSLFVGVAFGFNSNASAFQQRLYYDTRQFVSNETVFCDSRYSYYNSTATLDLINLSDRNFNNSYLGASFSYTFIGTPDPTDFDYAFSASLDLKKSYFDVSNFSSSDKLYILVYESHNTEEYSFSRQDISFVYNSDLDFVDTGWNNYISEYTAKYEQPVVKSYSYVVFDITSYREKLNNDSGYFSFYSRYSMDYRPEEIGDFNSDMKISFNYVAFSSSFALTTWNTPVIRQALGYIERGSSDSFSYVDLTYNAGPNDYLAAYYKDPYNSGYNQGKSDGYDEGYQSGYNQGKSDGYDEGYQSGYDQGMIDFGKSFNPFKNSDIVLYENTGNNTGRTFYEGKAEENTLIGSSINLLSYYQKYPTFPDPSANGCFFSVTLQRDYYITSEDLRISVSRDLDMVVVLQFVSGVIQEYSLNSEFMQKDNDGYYIFVLPDSYKRNIIERISFPNTYWYGSNSSLNDVPLRIENMTNSYQLGYQNGYSSGSQNGYNNGLQIGQEKGFAAGKEQGLIEGYRNGYDTGFFEGSGSDNTLVGMIFAVVDAPFQVLKDSMNFNFLGINVSDFIFSVLTMIIVIKIFKFIFGK